MAKAILTAFEFSGWLPAIVLPAGIEGTASAVAANLNKHLDDKGLIKFAGAGSGRKIIWFPVPTEEISQDIQGM